MTYKIRKEMKKEACLDLEDTYVSSSNDHLGI
jgi:hypothetical protein